MQKELLEYLLRFITPERQQLFERILEKRTRYITVVLEDIFQSQNASAVLRTCDCFGIQDVHIIENKNQFTLNRDVALGSSKWLTLNKYNEAANNSKDAIRYLRDKGYRIVATTPHTNDQDLQDFDLSKGKTALLFGSELPGISDVLMEEADEFLKIPMYGFTESFNISVSAAIILHTLSEKLRNTEHLDWELTVEEKQAIKYEWTKNTIKKSELLEERFWKEKNQQFPK